MKDMLKIHRLLKSFKKGNEEVNVLNDITFHVGTGEFISIVGPSGCGKSTLLNLIAGFDDFDSGRIMLKDKKIMNPEPSRIMVFQDFNQLFPWKTVLENVIFPLNLNRKTLSSQSRKDLAKSYLKMVKLEDYLNYYPHEISGGMKQRVAIARALVMKPKVLLMDEPFGSLDMQIKSEMHKILLQLWEETETTIVFVTHDIQEAVILSDRIIIMGNSPQSVKGEIINELERPRDKLSLEFIEMVKEVLEKIKE